MELIFNTNGNEKQKDVARAWLNSSVTDIVYGGSKGSGKSFLGCSLIFGDAFLHPNTYYFIARSSLTDLRKFTIPSVHEVLNHWGIPPTMYTYNGQDNFFQLKNGSRVYMLSANYLPSDPLYMRFGSMQMTRGWIEEAGEFEKAAKNNLAASIGRWKNDTYKLTPKLLQTCNPAKNYLYSDYYRPYKDGSLDPWKRFIQAFPQDNKMLPDGYLENLNRTLDRNQKERLLFGNWEFDDDPTVLCDYDAICDAFTNDHIRPTGDKSISADLAMQGRDRFVAGVWDGDVVEIALDKTKATGKEIQQALQQLMVTHGVPRSKTVADSDGLGAYLESYLNGIKEFHGGAKANDAEYVNLKSECAYKLAEKINKRLIKIICSDEQKQRIIDELSVLKSDSVDNDEGKKRIIKKDQMKELLGRSPDYLDMLLMRQVFDVRTKMRFAVIR